MYDKLVAKVNNIGTSGFVLKTKYDTDKSDLEKKSLDTSGLVKKTDNAKITEIENKIPSISRVATNFVLTALENEIPNISSLVKKKTDYNTKITETEKKLTNHNHDKYITTLEFNTLAASYDGNKIGVIFSGSCLKQHKITYYHKKVVSIYIA